MRANKLNVYSPAGDFPVTASTADMHHDDWRDWSGGLVEYRRVVARFVMMALLDLDDCPYSMRSLLQARRRAASRPPVRVPTSRWIRTLYNVWW